MDIDIFLDRHARQRISMVSFSDVPYSPLRELLSQRAPLAAIQQAYEANPDHWDWTLCQAWLRSQRYIPKTGVLGFLLPKLQRSFGERTSSKCHDPCFKNCFKWRVLSTNNTEESEQDDSLPAEEEFKSLVHLCGDFLGFHQAKVFEAFGDEIMKSAFENNFSTEFLTFLCQMFASKYNRNPEVPVTYRVHQDVFEAIQPLLNNEKNDYKCNKVNIICHWNSPALIPFLSRAMQATCAYEKQLDLFIQKGPDTLNVNDQVASIPVSPTCGFKKLSIWSLSGERCDGYMALAEKIPRLTYFNFYPMANWRGDTSKSLASLISNSSRLETFTVMSRNLTNTELASLLKDLAGPLKASQSIKRLRFFCDCDVQSVPSNGAKEVLDLAIDILNGNAKIKEFKLKQEHYSRTEPKKMESSEMEFARGLNNIRPYLPLPAVEDDSLQATINILNHLGNNRKYFLNGAAQENLFVSLRFYILKELVPYWNGYHIEPEVVNEAASSRGEHEEEANNVAI